MITTGANKSAGQMKATTRLKNQPMKTLGMIPSTRPHGTPNQTTKYRHTKIVQPISAISRAYGIEDAYSVNGSGMSERIS